MRNRAIRKSIIIITALMIISSMTAFAFALNSIHDDPSTPSSGGGGTGAGGTISVEVDTSKYDNEAVRDIVNEINAGSDKDLADILDALPIVEGKTDPEEYPTTEGYDVNMELYDRITDFYEVKRVTDTGYEEVGAGTVTVQIPITVGMDGNDLMILAIDSSSGELYLIPLKEFNSETGTLTFKMPCNGPYCVIHKIPIVVRNVDPSLYPNKKLAKIISKMPDNEVIDCDYFLRKNGENYNKLEVADGVTVDPSDYSSAIALSDVAVNTGLNTFSYNLSTKFKANLFRGNDKVDWERILRHAGVKYDKSAVQKDDKELTKLEPVKLKDCFVYHIDAKTREVSIIYEPTVCWSTYEEMEESKANKLTKDAIQYFDVDDIDEQNVSETQLQLEEESEEGESVSVLDSAGNAISSAVLSEVYADSDKSGSKKEAATDTEDVCLVINGDEYLGMGPFLLFMPKKSEAGFPWWIILLIILLILVVAYIIYRNKKQKKEGK